MENKNNLIAGLLVLIVGLLIGYGVAGFNGREGHQAFMNMHGSSARVGMDADDMDCGGMSGMRHEMANMMSGLEGKTGDDFDKAFLQEMIVHHEGAIDMAEALLKNTKRPELVKLGNDIIKAQTGEVSMMKGWLVAWFK